MTSRSSRIDFKAINATALQGFENLVRQWLPKGRVEGHEYVSLNPTRADTNPGSFKINLQTCVWKDFATGDGGSDPISLYAYLKKCSQSDAARALAKECGVACGSERPQAKAREKDSQEFAEVCVKALWKNHEDRLNYLRTDRGLSDERIRTSGYGFLQEGGKPKGYTVPVRGSHMSVIAAKVLVPPDLRTVKGRKAYWKRKPANGAKQAALHGLHALNGQDTVILTEGELDCDITADRLPGYGVVSGLAGAGVFDQSHADQMAGKRVVVIYDNDAPGRRGAEKVTSVLSTSRVLAYMTIELPFTEEERANGYKDLTDWFLHCSRPQERLEMLIDTGTWIFPERGSLSQSTEEGTSTSAQAEQQRVIQEMNETFAVASMGENAVIIREHYDHESGRDVTGFISRSDLNLLLENRRVGVETVDKNGKARTRTVPIAKFWLEHEDRRGYDQVIFDPDYDGEKHYNLWRGFSVQPIEGNVELVLRHIFEVMCDESQANFEWMLAWMADAVQNPSEPPGTAIVFRGKQGTGKGIFCREFGGLFGRHYRHVTHARHLTGHFNFHLADCLLLYADEAFGTKDKQAEAALKGLITEPELMIEAKGKNPILMRNRMRVLLTSNSDWCVPVGMEERRFCVLDVSDVHMQDHEYFATLCHEMENGGREALLHYLLQYDLSAVNLRQIPQTSGLREQKIHSLDPISRFWYERLRDGILWSGGGEDSALLRCRDLHRLYINDCNDTGDRCRSSQTQFGNSLRNLCPNIKRKQKRITPDLLQKLTFEMQREQEESDRDKEYVYEIPSLKECRDFFRQLTGTDWDWNDDNDQRN